MTRDTRILLAVFVVGLIVLGVFNYVLHVRFLGLAMQVAAPKPTPAPVVTEAPTVEPSPTEEASPTARGRATATPKVSPSASAEEAAE